MYDALKNKNIDRQGSKISFRRSTSKHPSSDCHSLFGAMSEIEKSAKIPKSSGGRGT